MAEEPSAIAHPVLRDATPGGSSQAVHPDHGQHDDRDRGRTLDEPEQQRGGVGLDEVVVGDPTGEEVVGLVSARSMRNVHRTPITPTIAVRTTIRVVSPWIRLGSATDVMYDGAYAV